MLEIIRPSACYFKSSLIVWLNCDFLCVHTFVRTDRWINRHTNQQPKTITLLGRYIEKLAADFICLSLSFEIIKYSSKFNSEYNSKWPKIIVELVDEYY